MKPIRTAPNTTAAGPAPARIAAGSQSLAIEISCGSMMMKIAPRNAPCSEPMPPMITIVTSSIDWSRVNCSGEMKLSLCA